MSRGAYRPRRTTGAEVARPGSAAAQPRPGLRSSGIVREFLGLWLAQAAFDLELVGLANPTTDARCIPKSGSEGCGSGLIVGVDLPRGGLDLERLERTGACRQLFRPDHSGLAADAHRGAVSKVRSLAFEAPVLADLQRHFDTCSIGRRVLPKIVVDTAPASIKHELSRTCCSPD